MTVIITIVIDNVRYSSEIEIRSWNKEQFLNGDVLPLAATIFDIANAKSILPAG